MNMLISVGFSNLVLSMCNSSLAGEMVFLQSWIKIFFLGTYIIIKLPKITTGNLRNSFVSGCD